MDRQLKVVCIGAGYVGGPTMIVLSNKTPQHKYFVYDKCESLIEQWKKLVPPIYELGLVQLLEKQLGKNLFFVSKIEEALSDADIIFIAVSTPTKSYGQGQNRALDISYIEDVTRDISQFYKEFQLDKHVIIVEKSTVPVNTSKLIKQIISDNQNLDNKDKFHVLSNPEFLSEGSAIQDLLHPDRVILGGNKQDQEYLRILRSLYENWIASDKILDLNINSSELSKIIANSFLAQRISSINSISAICEQLQEVEIQEISKGIGSDSRIGNKYLNCSVGFGGSCLKKDVLSLVYLCEYLGLYEVAQYWEQVILMNEYQKSRFAKTILKSMYNNINGKILSIFGVAFKKNTNDPRESSALQICHQLLQEKARLNIYDPQVAQGRFEFEMKQNGYWKEQYEAQIKFHSDVYSSTENSHAIIVLTDWEEFKSLDYNLIFNKMSRPCYIFDGRNILNQQQLEDIGFIFYSIGKSK